MPRAEAPTASDPATGTRVVLVDRQPLFLAALGRLLQGPPLNAAVEGTTAVAEAIALVDASSVELVLAEVRTGVEELVRHAAARGVPVILLDDGDSTPSPARALHAGAAGLFRKDSSPDEFLAGVAAVRAGHRALGSRLLENLIENVVSPSPRGSQTAEQLSPAERRVLALLAEGNSVADVAEKRGISPKTVRKHLVNIYRKLNVKTRSEAVLWAARSRLTGD